jgi:mRNA-degrading endonuclease RelE of RelBE toxin-antitoxin system
MSYRLIIKHEAFIDTVEAFIYYEHQQKDLGEAFLSLLDIFYERITKNPHHFPCKRNPYHEAFIKRFPFVIVYEIKDDEIIVYSVFNTHQNPIKKLK